MIIVVGGTSRIGRALRHQLSDRDIQFTTRQPVTTAAASVSDYRETARHFRAGAIVVNCVGISDARRGNLMSVNAQLAQDLAHMANEAGARHFIQLSSFSVYGSAHLIDRYTPEGPFSDYGRSKLAADIALTRSSSSTMQTSILRLPVLIGHPDVGKLGQLVRLAVRLGGLPIPMPDVQRSMITYLDAAFAIQSLIDQPVAGITHAADPQPFDYGFLAEQWKQATGKPLKIVRVPRLLTSIARRLLGKNGASLLDDSFLDPLANLAGSLALPIGLTKALHSTIAAELYR